MLHAFGRPQHREDRAHHRVDVDVGGTIQRVEQQQEFTLRIAVRNGVGLVHFLGGDGGQLPTPQIGFQQRVVGDHVQLLLGFPLHVLGAHVTQIVVQGSLADGLADALAGAGHHFQQQAQLAGNQSLLALHLHQVLGEADVFLHDGRTPEREIGRAFQGAPGAPPNSTVCICCASTGTKRWWRSSVRAIRAASCGLLRSSRSTSSRHSV